MNAVVVKVAPQVACGAAGLETTAVRLSLAADERPAAGWGGDETAKVLEKLEGVLIFSVWDVGPGLGAGVLVLVESGRGVYLETLVFVGNGLRGEAVFVGDCNLADRHQI